MEASILVRMSPVSTWSCSILQLLSTFSASGKPVFIMETVANPTFISWDASLLWSSRYVVPSRSAYPISSRGKCLSYLVRLLIGVYDMYHIHLQFLLPLVSGTPRRRILVRGSLIPNHALRIVLEHVGLWGPLGHIVQKGSLQRWALPHEHHLVQPFFGASDLFYLPRLEMPLLKSW